jgi:DNA-directed RNA polymerase subunit N (RpoN/RPB10)
MLQHYEDILSRISEPPRWFDEQGVPRYCEFAPDRIANARECALLAIECQSCGRPFIVALDDTT